MEPRRVKICGNLILQILDSSGNYLLWNSSSISVILIKVCVWFHPLLLSFAVPVLSIAT